jgi:pimeloyl-ACP methyl ester carboxylesterase
MATFVLVHGAWHGGWCWHKTASELEKLGHQVIAPDLPAHGDDATAPEDVDFDGYTARIREHINAVEGRVVLVGHSMGGLVISEVAEALPDRIHCLVYLAAILPVSGDRLANVPGSARLADAVESVGGGTALRFRPEFAREIFYADCSDADVAFAQRRLCPQPLGIRTGVLHLSEERFGRVTRDYVECLHDRAIEIDAQRDQVRRSPCRRVHTLESSHSPFFSMPEELARVLADCAD